MFLSLGLKHLKTAGSCFQMMSQMKNYQFHWYWWSLCLCFLDGELGKDTEDSLVVVSDTGCKLAGWESLDDSCGSLRSEECLSFTLVCFIIRISRSGSVTSSLNFLLFLVEVSHPGCLTGMVILLLTGLSSNLVFLACLLSWTLLCNTVSETKTWNVLVCLILPLHGSERTIFWPVPASCYAEMTKLSLVDGVFVSLAAEETEFCCKKEACNIGMSGLFGLMREWFLLRWPLVASTWVS